MSIERRVARELANQDGRRLDMFPLNDGRILGICHICPKKTCDIRGNGNRAFSSSAALATAEEVEDWFDAHRRTDMHAYYRDDPPMREASVEERQFAQIFGGTPPKRTVVPFKFARRYR
jgi:hypothetical protein